MPDVVSSNADSVVGSSVEISSSCSSDSSNGGSSVVDSFFALTFVATSLGVDESDERSISGSVKSSFVDSLDASMLDSVPTGFAWTLKNLHFNQNVF